MSDLNVDRNEGARDGAGRLIAHAAAADGDARLRLAASIDDYFLSESGRLDEQVRIALARLVRALVATAQAEVGGHAARLLAAQGQAALAAQLAAVDDVLERLTRAGLLRDSDLMAELIGRVRQALLADAMPAHASDDPDRPSLINRLAQQADRLLAQGASAVLLAESRRRGVPEHGALPQSDLPAELHHRLVWWVAAALRAAAGPAPALDRAIADAAQRSLAAHDEGDRLEAAVMRLAAAIDAQPSELPELLTEALGDRRVTLFAGLLAHALGIDYASARDIVLAADGTQLWVALRALDLPREAIARIGVALCEADPRRDVEAFAEQLDSIVAIATDDAREALAGLRLPGDFRAAIAALEGPR